MLLNIKSPVISKLILEKYLLDDVCMKLFKYNKIHQKKFGLSFLDYKDYNPIKIELIPVEPNKLKRIHNYFINFKRYKNNFTVYFNDNKERTTREYFTKEDNIYKIKINIKHKTNDISELFYIKNYGVYAGCDCIKEIKFTKFLRNNIEDMSSLFYNCSTLTKIHFAEFHSENVKNMSYMFYGCSSLSILDLSKFNTEKVTNMFCMFSKCSLLSELDFKNFDTKNVVNMANMFEKCEKLNVLKNFNFITDNVTNMSSMFEDCSSLKFINVSQFFTFNVFSFEYMFKGCSQLSYLDITGFIFKSDAMMREMFSFCNENFIDEIKRQNPDLKEEAFYNDEKLEQLRRFKKHKHYKK